MTDNNDNCNNGNYNNDNNNVDLPCQFFVRISQSFAESFTNGLLKGLKFWMIWINQIHFYPFRQKESLNLFTKECWTHRLNKRNLRSVCEFCAQQVIITKKWESIEWTNQSTIKWRLFTKTIFFSNWRNLSSSLQKTSSSLLSELFYNAYNIDALKNCFR